MTNTQTHVAVLMGGWSSEREVSLRSGAACATALEGARLPRDPPRCRPRRGGAARRAQARCLLQCAARPLSARMAASRACLRRSASPTPIPACSPPRSPCTRSAPRRCMRAAGVPVAESRGAHPRRSRARPRHEAALRDQAGDRRVERRRVHRARGPAPSARRSCTRADWTLGEELMVERYIPGRELTCAVMGEEALGVIEIRPAEGLDLLRLRPRNTPREAQSTCFRRRFYQMFTNWYRSCPWRLIGHWAAVGSAAPTSDSTTGAAATGEMICLEVNTQPGMTSTSLVPELAAHSGRSFGELVRWILEDASCNR